MGIAATFSSTSTVTSGAPSPGTLGTYNYVQGDTGPQLRLSFTDEDTGTATDLVGATATIRLRAKGDSRTVCTRPLVINPDTADTGVAIVAWQDGDLQLPPGTYEGEVEVIRASGVRETLFDVFIFNIRSEIV
jgi:hypothetical protein